MDTRGIAGLGVVAFLGVSTMALAAGGPTPDEAVARRRPVIVRGSQPLPDRTLAPPPVDSRQVPPTQDRPSIAPLPERTRGPRVEVAFLLDTTGSMGGLIEGAKRKIWSVANTIVSGKPTPQVRFGLIGYRDLRDDYVTRVHDLTDDIDAIYAKLREFTAGGGGDEPEHVNQALSDALGKLSWTRDQDTLRIVFLVGDAPPHDDYGDGLDSRKLARDAGARGIVVNTLRCGGSPRTEAVWREIATLAGGEYASIPQDGGVVAVATPMDGKLAKLNAELSSTMVAYGSRAEREELDAKGRVAASLDESSAAERASFAAKAAAPAAFGSRDLLSAVGEGRVDVTRLAAEDLPDEIKGMEAKDRERFVAEKARRRQELLEEISKVSSRRDEYLRQAASSGPSKADSFDRQVAEMIRRQAAPLGITYE